MSYRYYFSPFKVWLGNLLIVTSQKHSSGIQRKPFFFITTKITKLDNLPPEVIRMILIESNSWESVEALFEVDPRLQNMIRNMNIPIPVLVAAPGHTVTGVQILTATYALVDAASNGFVVCEDVLSGLNLMANLRHIEFRQNSFIPFAHQFVSKVMHNLVDIPTLQSIRDDADFAMWRRFLISHNHTTIALEDSRGNRHPPLPYNPLN